MTFSLRYLTFYPNGDDESSKSHVSLYLAVNSEVDIGFTVKFKVGILGKTEDENYYSEIIEKSWMDFREDSSWGGVLSVFFIFP
jgi:hypothetical protein